MATIKEPTEPQKMRQATRHFEGKQKGKYEKYYKCEVCKKTIKNNNYYSDLRLDKTGCAQFLCEKDMKTVESWSDEKFAEFFSMGNETERLRILNNLKAQNTPQTGEKEKAGSLAETHTTPAPSSTKGNNTQQMYRCNHCGHKVANPAKHWRENHDGCLYLEVDFRLDGEPKAEEICYDQIEFKNHKEQWVTET